MKTSGSEPGRDLIAIRPPTSEKEWADYFHLRWKLLRAPWGQPEGSEKDALEDTTVHQAAFFCNKLVGVARFQVNSAEEGQIRYMAVNESCRGKGVGRKLVHALEEAAAAKQVLRIKLDARENAVGFYQALGYKVIADSYLLFGEIRHFLMEKELFGRKK